MKPIKWDNQNEGPMTGAISKKGHNLAIKHRILLQQLKQK